MFFQICTKNWWNRVKIVISTSISTDKHISDHQNFEKTKFGFIYKDVFYFQFHVQTNIWYFFYSNHYKQNLCMYIKSWTNTQQNIHCRILVCIGFRIFHKLTVYHPGLCNPVLTSPTVPITNWTRSHGTVLQYTLTENKQVLVLLFFRFKIYYNALIKLSM